MSRRTSSHILLIVAGLAAIVLQAGCNQTVKKNHEMAVEKANDRWNEVRSGMYLQMAQRQFDAGDLKQAEKSLHDALAADAMNPQLHLLSGRIALERGQLERAYKRIGYAIELEPGQVLAYYYQGVVLQRWQRYDAALERYTRAYELEPDNVSYLLAMSEMHVANGSIDQAIELLGAKTTYFDTNANIRVALGHLHTLKGDHAAAADYFRKASILQPDDLTMVEELAFAQMADGQVEKAIISFKRLLNDGVYQDRSDIAKALAEAYFLTGRVEQAKATLVAVTRKHPDDIEAWQRLGHLAWAAEDHLAVLSASRRIIQLDPNNAEGYLLAGMVWQQRGDLDKALAMFDKATQATPSQAEGLVLRGIALERAGRYVEAKQAYSQALTRKPHDRRIRGLLTQVSTNSSQ